MRTLLLVGPFYGHCDFAPSPAQRLAAYGRYLPEYGWRTVVVATACRCTIADFGVPGPAEVLGDGETLVFDTGDVASMRRVSDAVRTFGASDQALLVLRPILSPPKSYRLWAKLAQHAGESSALREKMSWHWMSTFTLPKANASHRLRKRFMRRSSSLLGAYVRSFGHQRARGRMLHEVAAALNGTAFDATLGSHGYAPEVHAARRDRVPLVVELRDAVWRRWRPMYETIELARIAPVARLAAAVVHVTPGEQHRDRWWLGRGPRLAVIEHGFDPDEWETIRGQARPDGSTFAIRFLGTLYPHLHLKTFLDGYVRFLGRAGADTILFEYVGRSGEFMRELIDTMVPPELRSRVAVREAVPRHDALALMASADVLILPMSEGVPGGRFYEYLGSGRPILAVGESVDPYVADVLERTGAGRVAVGPEETADALISYWNGRGTDGVRPARVHDYTRRSQARKLAELLGGLVR